ncbi:hypothetical protein C8R44DRAFT_729475 [Mycena epipterygia]|nr:hypothetical protein C8R44DRAFT_729475 [Mycena epipterygia]
MVAVAVEVPSSPQAHVVFELLSLLFRDGTQHFNFEESKVTTHLETFLSQLPANDPNTSRYRLIFGEWNYTRYLRGRTGIQYGVSTFEHYFRHTLQTSRSPPTPLMSTCRSYLTKAIESYSVGLTSLRAPSSQDRRFEYLVKLATCLQARFVEMALDLDEAVNLLREALSLCGTQKSSQDAIRTKLADTLTERFKQSENPTDIKEAIQLYREALACYPKPGIGRGIALHNLANALYEQCMPDSKNLDECIQIYREGLGHISLSDPTLACSLTNLASAIQRRGVEMDATEATGKAILLTLVMLFVKNTKNSGDFPVIREAVTQFNYFLKLRNPDANTSIAGVTLDVHRLLGESGNRKPDHSVGHDGNLVDKYNKVLLPSGWQKGATHGFTIHNTSEEHLFPYLFFFDPVDYTIKPIYIPPAVELPPLRSRDTITLGMGPEHGFILSPNRHDMSFQGFLKLFVSTAPINFQWSSQDMDRMLTGDPFPIIKPNCKWDALSVSITSGPGSKSIDNFMPLSPPAVMHSMTIQEMLSRQPRRSGDPSHAGSIENDPVTVTQTFRQRSRISRSHGPQHVPE